jgi:hypothetical protein
MKDRRINDIPSPERSGDRSDKRAKTSAERMRAYRERKRLDGYREITLLVPRWSVAEFEKLRNSVIEIDRRQSGDGPIQCIKKIATSAAEQPEAPEGTDKVCELPDDSARLMATNLSAKNGVEVQPKSSSPSHTSAADFLHEAVVAFFK